MVDRVGGKRFNAPNDIVVSSDERWFHIVDTGSTHRPGGHNHLRCFAVGKNGVLSGGDLLLSDPNLYLDGFRVDVFGRLWCGAGNFMCASRSVFRIRTHAR